MTYVDGAQSAGGWVPDTGTFAARLALVRHEMGWHNADAASREYGLPKESYRDWEKGKYVPRDRLEICWKISSRTGCDCGWLYGGDEMTGRLPGGARAA